MLLRFSVRCTSSKVRIVSTWQVERRSIACKKVLRDGRHTNSETRIDMFDFRSLQQHNTTLYLFLCQVPAGQQDSSSVNQQQQCCLFLPPPTSGPAASLRMPPGKAPPRWEEVVSWGNNCSDAIRQQNSSTAAAMLQGAETVAKRMRKTIHNRMTVQRWQGFITAKVPEQVATAAWKVIEAVLSRVCHGHAASSSNSSSSRGSSSSSSTSANIDTLSVQNAAAAGAGQSDAQLAACAGFAVWTMVALSGYGLKQEGSDSKAPHWLAFTHQLLDPGYDLFPLLLRFAADWLPGESAILRLSCGSSSSSSGGGSGGGGGGGGGGNISGSSIDSGRDTEWTVPSFRMRHVVQLYIYRLLVWGSGSLLTDPGMQCAAAAMHAQAAVYTHVNTVLPAIMPLCSHAERGRIAVTVAHGVLSLWDSGNTLLTTALAPITATYGHVTHTGSAQLTPELQQYAASCVECPKLLGCLAVSLADIGVQLLLLQLSSLPDFASSGSSRGGGDSHSHSSSSSGGAGAGSSSLQGATNAPGDSRTVLLPCSDVISAWELAGQEHTRLPPSLQRLLQWAGCSSQTLVTAAARSAAEQLRSRSRMQGTVLAVGDVLPQFEKLLYTYRTLANLPHMATQQQQHQQHLQRLSVMHMLVPPLVLYVGEHQAASLCSTGVDSARSMRLRASVVQSASAGMAAASRLSRSDRLWDAQCVTLADDVLPLALQMASAVLDLPNHITSSSSSSIAGPVTGSSSSSTTTANTSSSTTADATATSSSANVVEALQAAHNLLGLITTIKRGVHHASGSGGGRLAAADSAYTADLTAICEAVIRRAGQLDSLTLPLVEDFLRAVEGPVLLSAQQEARGLWSGTSGSGSGSKTILPGKTPEFSPQLVHFFNIHVSLLKLCQTQSLRGISAEAIRAAGKVAGGTEVTALQMLQTTVSQAGADSDAPLQVSVQGALAGVPWLALWGRALLQIGSLLMPAAGTDGRSVQLSGLSLQAAAVASADTGAAAAAAAAPEATAMPALPAAADASTDLDREVGEAIRSSMGTVSKWLRAPGVEAAWAGVGFDWRGVLEKVEACSSSGDTGLPVALCSLGQALNLLPFIYSCNLPSCTNLSGQQEWLLVNGRKRGCGGCQVARYCSRDCQRQHWKAHREACKAVAASTGAASSTGQQGRQQPQQQ